MWQEEVVREWGYDELVLLVEATNFQAMATSVSQIQQNELFCRPPEARGVYDRMGYRLAGIRPGQVTTYLDTSETTSRVKERTTVTGHRFSGVLCFVQGMRSPAGAL